MGKYTPGGKWSMNGIEELARCLFGEDYGNQWIREGYLTVSNPGKYWIERGHNRVELKRMKDKKGRAEVIFRTNTLYNISLFLKGLEFSNEYKGRGDDQQREDI